MVTICDAEIHWYEAHGIGKKEFKFKSRSASSRRVASSTSHSKRPRTAPEQSQNSHAHYAICVRNDEYEASLELRKLYPVLEDEFGNQHGMIRVIDESGEDYLFPSEYFVRIELPRAIQERLERIA